MTCNRTLRQFTTALLCAGALAFALGASVPASAQIEGSSTGICVDYDGSYFTCGSRSGGGGGGYDDGGYGYGFDPNMFAFEMGMGLLGEMLGSFMSCALDPNCGGGGGGSDGGSGYDQGLYDQQILEKQLAAQAAFREEQKQLRLAAEAEQRAELAAGKERALGAMRDTAIELLEPRDLGSGVLVVAPEDADDAIFGQPTLKPRDIIETTPMTAQQKTACATYLLGAANRAAALGMTAPNARIGAATLSEASFLSDQAGIVVGGAGSGVEVACPGAPPDVEGAPVQAGAAEQELMAKQMTLYSRMVSRSTEQMADYRGVEANVQDAEKDEADARAKQEETQAALEAIEAALALLDQQAAQEPPPVEAPGETTSFSLLGTIDAEKARLEQERAERQSELDQQAEALAAAEKALAEQQRKFAELQQEMGETILMFDRLQNDPGALDVVLDELGGTEAPPPGG